MKFVEVNGDFKAKEKMETEIAKGMSGRNYEPGYIAIIGLLLRRTLVLHQVYSTLKFETCTSLP